MNILRQSTAVDVLIGPFVDSTDGDTEETALTINQADVLLSKNGQALTQKTDVTAAAHDADGYYNCELDATDTATVGTLVLTVHVAGALAVRHEFQVVEEAVYDQLFAASAPGAATVAALATVDGNVDSILVDTAEIGAAGAGLTAIPWNASWDAEVQSEAADALTAYDPPTKAELDSGLAGLNDLDAAGVRTAVGLASANLDTQLAALPTAAENRAEMDSNSTQLAAIVTDTGTDIPASIAALNDFDPATETVDIGAIDGNTGRATKFAQVIDSITATTVNDASATTTGFVTNLTEATDDHYNGRLITFIGGALDGQQTAITDYNGTTKAVTVTALTEAPADNQVFIIH